MQVSDIYEEVKEVTGTCDEGVNFRAITRAVEMLANSGLFDPLIGTVDFSVNGAYYVALPRDVKTPIRVNINNNPAVARNRIFEFTPNAPGTNEGEEVGWQWHERGYACIQDERKLPSRLRYVVTASPDIGKTIIVKGLDPNGIEREESLIGAAANSALSQYTYSEIRTVIRETTQRETMLFSDTGSIARYYADETIPEYRVIKLSQTGVNVRMIYRKNVFKITALTDIIPLHSPMAVIRAVDGVRLMQERKYEESAAAMTIATALIGQEQKTRDEGEEVSSQIEIGSAINTNINTNDVLIVADVYDMASDIIGPVGRQKIFDRLTDAINALSSKSQWDSLLGTVDVFKSQNFNNPEVASDREERATYFVLPRYVEAVLAVNTGGQANIPRNRWFEFHLNGSGSREWASCGTWDEAGDTCIVNQIPRKPKSREFIPVRLLAVPVNVLDENKLVTVYGYELDAAGREVEVWRSNKKGWTCPMRQLTNYNPPNGDPAFVRIDRIEREDTIGFVRLLGYAETYTANPRREEYLFGYWYPDELVPRYRMIRVGGCRCRTRIRYRKRNSRVTSLNDVINLRSRLALENMLRALAAQSTNPQNALMYEDLAVRYLDEEQAASNPIRAGGLQFDPGTSPGHTDNIQ